MGMASMPNYASIRVTGPYIQKIIVFKIWKAASM